MTYRIIHSLFFCLSTLRKKKKNNTFKPDGNAKAIYNAKVNILVSISTDKFDIHSNVYFEKPMTNGNVHELKSHA